MSPLGFDAIVSPSDGVAVMDSQLDKNVAFGIQQAVFSNLQPSTTYYFRVFSYSGSGNQIQYNTQDGVSQIQLTTGP
jgi:hypothetical protein